VQHLADFLDDSRDYKSETWVFLSGNWEDRKRTAYYFAPAFNTFGLAAAGYRSSTIGVTYRDAIKTNLHLVGTGEAAGTASAREKLDRDPII
jgi:hypothetical protein